MNRKLSLLSLLFVMLIGVGAYLWFFGTPPVPTENPLKNVDVQKMSGLVMKNFYGKTRIEKQNGVWKILEPVQDVVDPTIPTEIMTSLQHFTLGSIISENPARYGEFQVDPVQGAQVDVYVEGKTTPVLSGIIGKTSSGYENSYFRFAASSGPVYLASGLSQYQFRRDPTSFRLMSALSLPPEEPTRIRMGSGKKSWELSRSSQTWKTSAGKAIPKEQMDAIIHALRDLRANGFGLGSESPKELGLDPPATPYLVCTVDSGNAESTLTIGNLTAKRVPQVPSARYGRTSNRPAVLTLQESPFTSLLDLFSKLPK